MEKELGSKSWIRDKTWKALIVWVIYKSINAGLCLFTFISILWR